MSFCGGMYVPLVEGCTLGAERTDGRGSVLAGGFEHGEQKGSSPPQYTTTRLWGWALSGSLASAIFSSLLAWLEHASRSGSQAKYTRHRQIDR